jgi:hypothetical protein
MAIDAAGGAKLPTMRKIVGERLTHRLEASSDMAVMLPWRRHAVSSLGK